MDFRSGTFRISMLLSFLWCIFSISYLNDIQINLKTLNSLPIFSHRYLLHIKEYKKADKELCNLYYELDKKFKARLKCKDYKCKVDNAFGETWDGGDYEDNKKFYENAEKIRYKLENNINIESKNDEDITIANCINYNNSKLFDEYLNRVWDSYYIQKKNEINNTWTILYTRLLVFILGLVLVWSIYWIACGFSQR
jgi:hypothetical protein